MKQCKKLLSLLLSIVMVLSMVPISAKAAPNPLSVSAHCVYENDSVVVSNAKAGDYANVQFEFTNDSGYYYKVTDVSCDNAYVDEDIISLEQFMVGPTEWSSTLSFLATISESDMASRALTVAPTITLKAYTDEDCTIEAGMDEITVSASHTFQLSDQTVEFYLDNASFTVELMDDEEENSASSVGDVVYRKVKITNTGNIYLNQNRIHVYDANYYPTEDRLIPLDGGADLHRLAPGESGYASLEMTVTSDDADAGEVIRQYEIICGAGVEDPTYDEILYVEGSNICQYIFYPDSEESLLVSVPLGDIDTSADANELFYIDQDVRVTSGVTVGDWVPIDVQFRHRKGSYFDLDVKSEYGETVMDGDGWFIWDETEKDYVDSAIIYTIVRQEDIDNGCIHRVFSCSASRYTDDSYVDAYLKEDGSPAIYENTWEIYIDLVDDVTDYLDDAELLVDLAENQNYEDGDYYEGDFIRRSFTITNNGSYAVKITGVEILSGITQDQVEGEYLSDIYTLDNVASDGSLQPGETIMVDLAYQATQEDIEYGAVIRNITVHADVYDDYACVRPVYGYNTTGVVPGTARPDVDFVPVSVYSDGLEDRINITNSSSNEPLSFWVETGYTVFREDINLGQKIKVGAFLMNDAEGDYTIENIYTDDEATAEISGNGWVFTDIEDGEVVTYERDEIRPNENLTNEIVLTVNSDDLEAGEITRNVNMLYYNDEQEYEVSREVLIKISSESKDDLMGKTGIDFDLFSTPIVTEPSKVGDELYADFTLDNIGETNIWVGYVDTFDEDQFLVPEDYICDEPDFWNYSGENEVYPDNMAPGDRVIGRLGLVVTANDIRAGKLVRYIIPRVGVNAEDTSDNYYELDEDNKLVPWMYSDGYEVDNGFEPIKIEVPLIEKTYEDYIRNSSLKLDEITTTVGTNHRVHVGEKFEITFGVYNDGSEDLDANSYIVKDTSGAVAKNTFIEEMTATGENPIYASYLSPQQMAIEKIAVYATSQDLARGYIKRTIQTNARIFSGGEDEEGYLAYVKDPKGKDATVASDVLTVTIPIKAAYDITAIKKITSAKVEVLQTTLPVDKEVGDIVDVKLKLTNTGMTNIYMSTNALTDKSGASTLVRIGDTMTSWADLQGNTRAAKILKPKGVVYATIHVKLTKADITAGSIERKFTASYGIWGAGDKEHVVDDLERDVICKTSVLPISVKLRILPKIDVNYRTHVQSIGWQKSVRNGAMSGTYGISKRLEGIEISVKNNPNVGIVYTTHCQSYGWLPWSSNGDMNGTEGEAKRLEAIMIKLTGSDAQYYDVYYRVHAQSYGWLGWAKNGEPAGTAGYGKRLEGLQIAVVKKGEPVPNVSVLGTVYGGGKAYYAKSGSSPIVNNPATSNENPVVPGDTLTTVACRTHIQSIGWQGWKFNGQMSGTSGMAKRLEGINIKLQNAQYAGGITYRTHVQTYGWQAWKSDGAMAGTSGEGKRLEAIEIKLTGEMAKQYDVYYRVHAQSYGWLGWAKNGASSGTAGYGKRLEGIQVVLVKKGDKAPSASYMGVTSINPKPYIQK